MARRTTGRIVTRRDDARNQPGFFGIGTERGKTSANLGTLWRSAACLGASYMFTVKGRYHPQASDTIKSWKHVPLWQFDTIEAFKTSLPRECLLIGVELTDDAKPLETFAHPPRAAYLLGPEDGSLSAHTLSMCHDVIRFSSKFCLNVAAAGTVVMYDRAAKAHRNGTRVLP